MSDKKRIAVVLGQGRRFFARDVWARITGAGEPVKVDAAEAHPGIAEPTSPEEYAAGLAAELADVAEGADLPSRSRKKQKQIGARVPRRFRRSKLATWRDSATAVLKHREARAARVRREKAARRRSTNGRRRAAQGG